MISSLNSTCSCLYVYFSRTLPRWHLDTQMCPKAPKWAPKGIKTNAKHNFLLKWPMCVSHSKYHAFLHTGPSEMPPKTKEKHTATHALTLVSKIMKMLVKLLKRELPWTLETLHCSRFCDFDASLFRVFFKVRKIIDFWSLLSKFFEGPAAGGGAPLSFRFCRFCKKYPARPAPLKGRGEYIWRASPPAAGP